MDIKLQEWIHKLPEEDRKRLAHALRFDSHPNEIVELMAELRAKYNFVPKEPSGEG